MFDAQVYKQNASGSLTGYIHYSNWGNGMSQITWQVCETGNGVVAHGIAKSHHAAKIAITKTLNKQLTN